MVRKSYGRMRGTRRKLRMFEKPTISRFLEEFKVGQTVQISICSSEKGFPHPRFQGKRGLIKGIRGKSYVAEIRDMDAVKEIIVKPVHLKHIK